jgi:hypothetical protein
LVVVTRHVKAWIARLSMIAMAIVDVACKASPPIEHGGPTCEIEEDNLKINGAPMRFVTSVREWKQVLGPSSRQVDRAGGIEIWDDLGMFVAMSWDYPQTDPHVAAVWWTFEPHTGDFWPKHPFTGTLKVDGSNMHAGQTEADLKHSWPADNKPYDRPPPYCGYTVGYEAPEERGKVLAVYMRSRCPVENRPPPGF